MMWFTAWHTAEMDSAQNFHIETTNEVLFLKNAYRSLSRAIFQFFVLTNRDVEACLQRLQWVTTSTVIPANCEIISVACVTWPDLMMLYMGWLYKYRELRDIKRLRYMNQTSNGSWRQGIKGEMTCTVYVALVWNITYWIMMMMIIIIMIIIIK